MDKEAKKRELIQLIQSRCVHRRLGIVKGSDVVYCQDCEKILYHLNGEVIKNESKLKTS
jgi:hypothetical protein